MRFLAGLLLAFTGSANAAIAQGVASPAVTAPLVQITPVSGSANLGLRATGATLEAIATTLGRATGCVVVIDARLGRQRITLDLSARAPERLFVALARRAGARASLCYRIEPAPAAVTPQPGSRVFAGDPVSLEIARPVELAEALQRLEIPFEVMGGLQGPVRVFAARTPLAQVLDGIAAQTGGAWQTIVRLEARRPVDGAAAQEERECAYYSDLARLSSAERQEELRADLDALLALPADRCSEGLRCMAAEIVGMEQIIRAMPGEHRAPILARVQAVTADYTAVLQSLSSTQQAKAEPIFRAVRELQRRLAEI